MSLFTDGFAVISLGQTLPGTDEGNLVNTEFEGLEADLSYVGNVHGTRLFTGHVGCRSRVRIMRNTTGGVVYAGELVITDPSVGVNSLGLATAKSSADSKHAVVVDPTLSSAGCADDDLFIAFVRGPCKIKAPAAGITPTAASQEIKCGASGRFAELADLDTESTLLLGHLCADDSAISANALAEAYLTPTWA